MKKVHITLGIPAEYRRLSSKEKIKQIKDEVLARPIAVVELAANGGRKKRSSSPAYEHSTEKKPMTSFAACGGSSATKKLVIDLTSPKGIKKSIEPELVKLAAPKYSSRAKCGSTSKRLAVMKSGKVDSTTKADLPDDVDACAKFVDSVGKVIICSYSFAKCPVYSKRSSLIATMHKTLILATESMSIDQDAIKCAKEAEVVLVA
ncbi:hypothetical protein ACFX2H_029819 [Malus domestica]